MYGEPEDVNGECNKRLHIGDNFGDNHATMRCQLAPGHAGLHQERYDGVTVTWPDADCAIIEEEIPHARD